MKVALVSFYLMESTIPLAKYLSLNGTDVDIFSLLPYNDQNTFVYNFTDNKQPIGFVNSKNIRNAFGKNLMKYLSKINLKVYIFPDRRIQKFFLIDLFSAYKLSKEIKKRRYDLIHIIHTTPRFWYFLYLFLDKKKVVQTLHEVISHDGKSSYPEKRNLKVLVRNYTPIIFHSETSLQRYLEFRTHVTNKEMNEDQLAIIRFGLFETYFCFSGRLANERNHGKLHILTFGRIVPSKGIHLLIEAVKILQEQYPVHLIVAGKGEPYFDFNGIISYEFINRFISNEEIVGLIKKSDMVVMPYTSASQSGIPMTVYAFNKPIVASNIAGLKEVIDHLKTGILVDNLDGHKLALAIETLLVNKDLKENMSKNIKEKYSEGEFSWPFIANKTIDFYKKQLKKKRPGKIIYSQQ